MKTLDEVIKALEELGDFVAECNYCSAEYCNESYEFDKCYSGEALHYLKAFRDAKNTLEREKDRYREAVKNCEEAENKYKMLSGKLDGFPSAEPEQKTGKWIPCSEALPKPWEEVLTTYEYNGKRYVQSAEYAGQNDENGHPLFCAYSDEYSPVHYEFVYVAWMPLPEPWRGEQ